jgi:hypothetical protein
MCEMFKHLMTKVRRAVSVQELIWFPIILIVLGAVFAAMYPSVTTLVTTVLTNTSSTGYVGASWVGIANLIPTLYVIGFIVGLLALALGMIKFSGLGGKGKSRY